MRPRHAVLLALGIMLAGCSTISASKGDFSLSRTAVGINLAVPKLSIKNNPDGSFSISMQGATADSAQAIEAALSGAMQGAAKGLAP